MHSGGQGERDRRQEQRPAPGQGLLWPGSQLAPKGADYLDFLGTAAPKRFRVTCYLCHLSFWLQRVTCLCVCLSANIMLF